MWTFHSGSPTATVASTGERMRSTPSRRRYSPASTVPPFWVKMGAMVASHDEEQIIRRDDGSFLATRLAVKADSALALQRQHSLVDDPDQQQREPAQDDVSADAVLESVVDRA